MTYLLILVLSIINPPKLVIVYQISSGDPMINNTVEIKETYAYKPGYFMREIRNPRLYPGFRRTIYNINANKTSMLTKQFTKAMIYHLDEPSTTLIKKLEVADYSITYDKKDRKTILGYEAYKTIIEDRTHDKTIVVYTC
jgi:hypothetical protein